MNLTVKPAERHTTKLGGVTLITGLVSEVGQWLPATTPSLLSLHPGHCLWSLSARGSDNTASLSSVLRPAWNALILLNRGALSFERHSCPSILKYRSFRGRKFITLSD